MSQLTPKQEKFVQEYYTHGIASMAYRAAYDASNMSDDTVYKRANELLKNGKVTGRLKALCAETNQKYEITRERTLEEAARLAFFDIRTIFNPDGSLKRMHELTAEAAAAIAGIDTIEVDHQGQLIVTKKFKLADKNAALEKLFKHLGLYERDNEQKTDPIKSLLASITVSAIGPVANPADDEDD